MLKCRSNYLMKKNITFLKKKHSPEYFNTLTLLTVTVTITIMDTVLQLRFWLRLGFGLWL